MNYYRVVARKGHEGAGKYSNLVFAIEAETMYDAMQITKRMPMVKHSRNNAIVIAELITKEEFDRIRSESAYKDCKGYKENKE